MNYSKELISLIDECCDNIHQTFDCQVIFIDCYNNRLNGQYISHIIPPYQDKDATEYLIDLFKDKQTMNKPIIVEAPTYLYYIGIDLLYNQGYYGKYIIGPFQNKDISFKEIELFYQSNKTYDPLIIKKYYQSIKTCPYEAIQVYALLCKNIIDKQFFGNEDSYFSLSHQKEYQELINKDLDEHIDYNGYNVDKIMIECVKNGYPKQIDHFIHDYYQYNNRKILLTGNLRDRKNFSISFVAILIQAAIEGGMNYEIACKTHLKYIRLIENKRTTSELEQLEISILYDLSNNIKKIKRQGQTKLIRDCKDYINENIHKDIKIYELAEHFNVNDKYLSRRFKKETNETIKNYITRKKVEEAKRLIQSTDMKIADIVDALSFYDQSHFIKVFKNYSGYTPKQYYDCIKSGI